MVYPWGEERLLRKSVVSYKSKHGLKKDSKVQVWMDCIKEQKLADNIILVSWQSWQQSTSKLFVYHILQFCVCEHIHPKEGDIRRVKVSRYSV